MKKLIVLSLIFVEIVSLPKLEVPKRDLEETKSDDIIILHTNDVHCGVQDTIGYDGLMLYKRQMMNKYKNVILVDAGDHIQGGTMGVISNGLSLIDIMNKIGYDVAALGNHEFDYGIAQLEECEQRLNCSYISCNYCFTKNKTAIYPPYKIIEKGGKKIGFIGVSTPQTLSKTYLITMFDEDGELIYDFLTDNNSKELYERVQEHINTLRNDEKVDYIIIIAHLGIGGDALEENTSAGLVKNIHGVDAVIDGHSHLVYSQTTPDINGTNVILAQTGTKLANIGVLTIHTNGTLTHENIGQVPYDPTLADQTINTTRSGKETYVDKEIYEYINEIFDSFSDVLNRVVGKTDFPLNVYRNATESTNSRTQLSRVQENVLCNLVTDALRELGEADVTIMNAGSVRSDINQGNITYQQIINTMPFSNDVLVKKIPGQAILDALEFGVRILPDPTSRFPQVSGITYKIDTSINSSVVVDENEIFVNVSGERRVYDVKVNGEDLDVNKNYTISTNSFIINGGDGYSMFVPHEVITTSIGVDNEVLLKYIENNLGGVIPEKYKEVEGRIVKTEGKILNSDTITDNQKQTDSETESSITVLGFQRPIISNTFISFFTFLRIPYGTGSFPKIFYFIVTLFSNSFLRALDSQNKTVTCNLDTDSGEQAKYLCECNTTTSDITAIQIHKNENFENSPLALKYMDDILKTPNYDLDSVYVLENSVLNHYEKLSFKISGVIANNSNNHPLFNDSDITLFTTKTGEDEESEIECKINYVTGNNYTLDCEMDKNTDCELDGSVSIIDNKTLIVEFDDNQDSIIKYNSTESNNNTNRIYHRKSSGGLNGGAIAAIVIVPVVALAATNSIFFLLSKTRGSAHRQIYTSSESINNINK